MTSFASAISYGKFARGVGWWSGSGRVPGGLLSRIDAKAEIGGPAGQGLNSKPVLDLGEFHPARVGAWRLARMLS